MSIHELGYVRVSTSQQSLDQQLDALHALGVEKVFQDKMSGARDDRPGLLALMEYARPGDRVTVVALDRLGRSLSGIIRTIDEMGEAGVTLRSLREGCGLLDLDRSHARRHLRQPRRVRARPDRRAGRRCP